MVVEKRTPNVFTDRQIRILKRCYAARANEMNRCQRARLNFYPERACIWCDGRSARRLVAMGIIKPYGVYSYFMTDAGWQMVQQMVQMASENPTESP